MSLVMDTADFQGRWRRFILDSVECFVTPSVALVTLLIDVIDARTHLDLPLCKRYCR